MSDVAQSRRLYDRPILELDDLDPDPFNEFGRWFGEVVDGGAAEPNSVILATSTPNEGPSQRTVLLKYWDRDGLVFFTNLGSRKAQAIEGDSRVSLLFPWYLYGRQCEVNGTAKRLSNARVLSYFATRPRGSQLGAWVSAQSEVVSSRGVLKAKLADLTKRFTGQEVPLPRFWGGFVVQPHRFEFWQGQADRLHDRFEYARTEESWERRRLQP